MDMRADAAMLPPRAGRHGATTRALGRFVSTMPSPVGDLLLISDGSALTGLFMIGAKHDRPESMAGAEERDDAEPFAEVRRQLVAYFAGELRMFHLPLRPTGTPFQRAVWSGLERIVYGSTMSYAALARAIDRPRAVRAVGAANGRNPISIIIPCHRVIGADGHLTGYGGGLERKKWLLEHEARVIATRADAAASPARAELIRSAS